VQTVLQSAESVRSAWKILPAIAAGNTVVLKPAELTPLTSVAFAEAAQRAGIPDGVVNVITGRGSIVGEALVGHRDVSMVSFTGSTRAGSSVGALAASLVKRVHLELGGKAPFVVFDDADLEAAARGAVAGSLINAGQDCTAATRAYVQRPLYDAFVGRVAELMAQVVVGPTDDPATELGSLMSAAHRDKVAGMVERARAAGAKVVTGGRPGTGALEEGAYYEPTLVVDAAQDSEIVQEEIFGPVLVVLPFDADADGLELANDTPYGLAASAWTTDVFRGPAREPHHRRRLRVDQRPHSDHQRDAARRVQGVRVRQGHEHVLLRRVHPGQARHVGAVPGAPEVLARRRVHQHARNLGRSRLRGGQPHALSSLASSARFSSPASIRRARTR
jgi:acyl-CoA reductase-like NAD-dependent aldehyde dehydrogenase